MKKLFKSVLCVILALSLVFALAACGEEEDGNKDKKEDTKEEKSANAETAKDKKKPEKNKELTVIRIGTHAQVEDDPYLLNEITGETDMHSTKREATITALEKVKDELGVELQFVQYESDLQQLLSKGIHEGEPYCELAIMWGGSQGAILSQNVLQPLDKYADIFLDDPDAAWLLPAKTFDHYYLLNRDLNFTNTWPIVYNATMLEKIPALIEEDGTTLYPSEMYYRGEWTWSNFEDYMAKVRDYYEEKTTSEGAEIVPFNTNYTFFGQMALHSVGASIFDGEAGFYSEEAIQAAEFVDKLITDNLVSCSSSEFGKKADSGWLTGTDAFTRGETVFTNCARWRMNYAGTSLYDRGESMGIIPFPYPDGTDQNDSSYRHLSSMGDSVGLLRGIDEETSRLALEAYKMYKIEYYKALGKKYIEGEFLIENPSSIIGENMDLYEDMLSEFDKVESIDDYINVAALVDATLSFGIDVFHPEIGEDNLKIWTEFGSTPQNEFSEAVGTMWNWGDILGNSIYGVNGYSKYSIEINRQKSLRSSYLNRIYNALQEDTVIDTITPSIKLAKPFVVAATDNFDDSVTDEFIKVTDNFGDDDIENVSYDYSQIKFAIPGIYTLTVGATDKSGNSTSVQLPVSVYDPDNTTPPTIVCDSEQVSVMVDSYVVWKNFAEALYDSDGIDLSFMAENENDPGLYVDESKVDYSRAGEYVATLTLTDYAGNQTSLDMTVSVTRY